MTTIIDPPEGWRYGFPKPYTPREGQRTEDWLREQGLPERLIALGHCRFWEEPDGS